MYTRHQCHRNSCRALQACNLQMGPLLCSLSLKRYEGARPHIRARAMDSQYKFNAERTILANQSSISGAAKSNLEGRLVCRQGLVCKHHFCGQPRRWMHKTSATPCVPKWAAQLAHPLPQQMFASNCIPRHIQIACTMQRAMSMAEQPTLAFVLAG